MLLNNLKHILLSTKKNLISRKNFCTENYTNNIINDKTTGLQIFFYRER